MTEEYWFQTADGIRKHHAQLRREAEQDHTRIVQRINSTEAEMIDALAKSKAKYAEPVEPKGRREEVGVAMTDALAYQVIGRRLNGSFRSPLLRYGMDADKVRHVIDDLDCDRDVTIQQNGHTYRFRAL